MLTLREVLDDAAALDEFAGIQVSGANTRGRTGRTPLHWMATLGDVPATELLLNAGADLHAADFAGETPLHVAVRSRQSQVVEVLLRRGAHADAKNAAGMTPRDLAEHERFEPTLVVLRGGAV